MSKIARSVPFAFAFAVASAWLFAPLAEVATAQEEEEGAAPPAAAQEQLYEQSDRKRTLSMMFPRSWKNASGDEVDPNALATFKGFWGEESKGIIGFAWFFEANQHARAVLARAVDMPSLGSLRESSFRQGPGWAEAAYDSRGAVFWRRYLEKDGHVYFVSIAAPAGLHGSIRETAEKLLDTAKVTGDSSSRSLGEGWKEKKSGNYDVLTDAGGDRDASVKRACEHLGDGREAVTKALPGKPFDGSRPKAWIFQNGQKYEDVSKAAIGIAPDNATYNPADRAAMVSIMGENTQGYQDAAAQSGARQYVWQYFGGTPPIWVDVGLAAWGRFLAVGGGKKLLPETISQTKSAVAAGKRRLDQWFDVKSWNEVTDNDQGTRELFAWHWYFKNGKSSKKYKKAYDGYVQTLRETGDPAAARKQFDGTDFDEMLQDFKGWAADWKP